MAIILGANRYGKAEVRVVRLTRHGDTHELLDLSVTTQLSGDFAATHLTGANAHVIPTDTQKNTVFALSKLHGAMEPEAFGLVLARHFLASFSHVSCAEVRLEQFPWQRIMCAGRPHPRAFQRDGSSVRTALVRVTRAGSGFTAEVSSGLEGLVVLKTSDSEFTGFSKDQFTTLAEARDRIMATEVSARWRHGATDAASLDATDWATSHATALDSLLSTYAEHYSLSLQQTLHEMGRATLERLPGLTAIKLSLPNKHHFVVDLSPFGMPNDNEVFFAGDRPYGLIEAVIARDDVSAVPDPWPAW
ncbi:MAG: urate oxidase [Phycisphaerales bacterium]|nr:urate oxidase [Phycisphaerales bacterium]